MVPLLPWVCDVSLKDGLPGPLGEPWLATLQISMKFREHIEAALALASSASGRNLWNKKSEYLRMLVRVNTISCMAINDEQK